MIRGAPDHEPEQRAGSRAERAADAELAVAVRDRMRGHAVDADDADAERDRGEDGEQRCENRWPLTSLVPSVAK
jgi:hypothetical protein